MAASITTPADVANLALDRIGWKGPRIADLYEGSAAAKKILDVYAQERDALLREQDFNFAERNINMTLLKSAPDNGYGPGGWSNQYPSIPWLFSYEYPSDCLRVRAIKPQPIFVINFDPQPHTFSIENDNSFTPARKVILCNVRNAMLTYTGQIMAPDTWEPTFVEAFSARLGRIIAPSLMGMEATKFAAADEAQAKMIADVTQG
jgi:hypothetical protein